MKLRYFLPLLLLSACGPSKEQIAEAHRLLDQPHQDYVDCLNRGLMSRYKEQVADGELITQIQATCEPQLKAAEKAGYEYLMLRQEPTGKKKAWALEKSQQTSATFKKDTQSQLIIRLMFCRSGTQKCKPIVAKL